MRARLISLGMVIATIIALMCTICYGWGRASIADQCEQNRAFVYGTDAWGCVKLKKHTFDLKLDYNSEDGVNL